MKKDGEKKEAGHLEFELATAVASGKEAKVRELLEAGADPNAIDAHGWGGGHAAASRGAEGCLRELLKAGLDPSRRDGWGVSPGDLAARNGQIKCLVVLLEGGWDASEKDGDGETAEDFARERGHSECEELLSGWRREYARAESDRLRERVGAGAAAKKKRAAL